MSISKEHGICEEYDVCRVFDFLNVSEPPDRFEVYKDHTSYMTARWFLHITGGAGATHTFRRIMRETEREYQIRKELSSDSSHRAFLFFLRTALFWDRFCSIRDPVYVPQPLIVLNAPREVIEAKSFPIPVNGKMIFVLK